MLSLYIDNLPAVIQSGTSFKLTRENPAFSEQGDYTFEVTLPLAGCPENQRIFGAVHRTESPHQQLLTDKTFRLVSPVISLKGKVAVQSVTESDIKVQLVAGRSEANFNAKDDDGNDLYIDQLDLGTVFDEYDIRHEMLNSGKAYDLASHSTFDFKIDSYIHLCDYLEMTGNDFHRQHGTWEQTSVVFYPFMLSSDKANVYANQHTPSLYARKAVTATTDSSEEVTVAPEEEDITKELVGDNNDYCLGDRVVTFPLTASGAVSYKNNIRENGEIFPQPRLYEILRRVLRAIGFELQEYDDDFVRSVFIVNHAREIINLSDSYSEAPSIKFAKMVPHWTVSDFVKEFNNFFATIIIFHDDGTAEIRSRYDFYSSAASTGGVNVEVEDMYDELEIDFEDESVEDNSSTGNVDYAWPTDDDMLRLPDDVWEKARVYHFDTYDLAKAYFDALDTATRVKSNFLLVDDSTGNVYASLKPQNATESDDYQLIRVEYYPPIIRDTDSRDITTELKIVPARMNYTSRPHSGSAATNDSVPLLISTAEFGEADSSIDINATINSASSSDSDSSSTTSSDDNESTTTSKSDYMEVALGLGDAGVTAMTTEAADYIRKSYKNEPIGKTTTIYISSPQQSVPIPFSVMWHHNTSTNFLTKMDYAYSFEGMSFPADGPFILTDDESSPISKQGLLELITSRVEHQLKFLVRGPLDITAAYLIRGRRYVCHKLEYSIHPDYVDPLVTGYFYELNE